MGRGAPLLLASAFFGALFLARRFSNIRKQFIFVDYVHAHKH